MARSSSRCSMPITWNTAICNCCCSRGAAESSSFTSSDLVGATRQSTCSLCKQLITKLYKKWKHTQIIVREDSHFYSHDFMDWATEQQDGIHFITGLAGNVKLQKITAHLLDTAVASYKATGEEVRMFHSFMYKSDSGSISKGLLSKSRSIVSEQTSDMS